MSKKIIFVDWDGTLSSSKFWHNLRNTNDNFAKKVDNFFSFEKQIVNSWMSGLLTSEYINKLISGISGISEHVLWMELILSCENMEIRSNTVDLIQKVRLDNFVILVTGNMDCFTRFTVPALKLKDKFDLIVNSADVGYLKTDYNGKIFIDCLKKFGIDNIKQAYLIEDSLNTCNTFIELGGTAFKVNDIKETDVYLEKILMDDVVI